MFPGCSPGPSSLRLSPWLYPRPEAWAPGAPASLGAEPAVYAPEERHGARAASPVRARQPPDPRPAGRGAGAAGEGANRLQVELLRPTLWQTTGGAPGRRPGTSDSAPGTAGFGHAGRGWGRASGRGPAVSVLKQ